MKLLQKVLAIAVISLSLVSTSGCSYMASNPTATQQITAQTQDPAVIARATYLDALGLYNTVAASYLPYQAYLQKENPELDREATRILVQMNTVLDQWNKYSKLGVVPSDSETLDFTAMRRQLLAIILELEGGK